MSTDTGTEEDGGDEGEDEEEEDDDDDTGEYPNPDDPYSSVMLETSTYLDGAALANHIVPTGNGSFHFIGVPKLAPGGMGGVKLGILAKNKAFVNQLNNRRLTIGQKDLGSLLRNQGVKIDPSKLKPKFDPAKLDHTKFQKGNL
jgi:hypothetical protein